jgi:hypothetical protein
MDAVGELQEELQEFWQGSKAAIHASLGDDVTFRDLQYTMDLVSACFSKPKQHCQLITYCTEGCWHVAAVL